MDEERQLELALEVMREASKEAAETLSVLVCMTEKGFILDDIDIPTTNEEIIDHGE